MSDDSGLTPALPVHPGMVLRAELHEHGMTWKQLRDAVGFSLRTEIGLRCYIQPITPEIAVGLERVLGTDAQTWLNMQAAYDKAQEASR